MELFEAVAQSGLIMLGKTLTPAAGSVVMLGAVAAMTTAQPVARIPTRCDPIPYRQQMIRSITMNHGEITLGAPLPALLRRGSKADRVIYLGGGVVPRATNVVIVLAADGRVRGIAVNYATDSARFDTLTNSYQRRLGRVPIHTIPQPPHIRTIAACWHDTRSLFRIAGILDPTDSSVSVQLYAVPNG